MVWESPAIPGGAKACGFSTAIVAGQSDAAEPIRNFLAMLIDHGRIPMMAQIARQFETELNSGLGFVEADITSSRQLSDG